MTTKKRTFLALTLSPAAMVLASCSAIASVDNPEDGPAVVAASDSYEMGPFSVTDHGTFDKPWAADIEPGTGNIFITEKEGTVKFYQPASGKMGFVSGVPDVDFGGQGGLGDIAFAPDYEDSGRIYLSWAEAGDGDTRGAVVGRGTLSCDDHDSCAISDLDVIWRQTKSTGRGHYSHRLAFSPDGQYLFVASGDRQKMQPAQDNSNNIGTIVRLNLDGTSAGKNPFGNADSPTDQIWSYGHRNILGMDFDAEGRLWDVEHGPAGGDELNLVKMGANYGWPVVSDGDHYDGEKIPDNSTRPDLAQSAITWTPVIAPGDMTFLSGEMFGEWAGDALIAGMSSNALVHIKVDGENAHEAARYDLGNRIRVVLEAPDGAIWVLEDGEGGKLMRLTPKR